jgi:hypothetical protein
MNSPPATHKNYKIPILSHLKIPRLSQLLNAKLKKNARTRARYLEQKRDPVAWELLTAKNRVKVRVKGRTQSTGSLYCSK